MFLSFDTFGILTTPTCDVRTAIKIPKETTNNQDKK